MARKPVHAISASQLRAIQLYLDRHPREQDPMATLNYARMVTRQLMRVMKIDDPTKEI